MKKIGILLLLILLLALPGCGGGAQTAPLPATPIPVPSSKSAEEEPIRVLATTYPVYLFARTLTAGVEGIEVERLHTGAVSCLHDYTLTVGDMTRLEQAHLVALSGAGLEEFLASALATASARVVDCSRDVALRPASEHEGHSHDHDAGHYDPHYWLDPRLAAEMLTPLAQALAELDPDNAPRYEENRLRLAAQLEQWHAAVQDALFDGLEGAPQWELVTFHDGFRYFAEAWGLTLLWAVEEEEGATASAQDIRQVVALVREHDLPAVFVERNGYAATAETVARETGVRLEILDLIMDGEGEGAEDYFAALLENAAAVRRAFAPEEGTP